MTNGSSQFCGGKRGSAEPQRPALSLKKNAAMGFGHSFLDSYNLDAASVQPDVRLTGHQHQLAP
jgi:hypothetical protein